MATTKPDVAALVEQMPEVDQPGKASKFTGPAPEAAEKIFAEILGGGRASIEELIRLVRDPGDPEFTNYKAGYVLHGLALYAGRSGKESQRRMFADTLAAQLGQDQPSKAVKGFLIRELQVCGGREVVRTLGKQLQDEHLGEFATLALVAIRDGAGAELRGALRSASGTSRVSILQALGVLRDPEAAAALKKALGEGDRNVRLAAAWALANIGDASADKALLKLADAAEGWERIQATKACLLLAERLVASRKKTEALRIYAHLRDTRKEPGDAYVREVAERALNATRSEVF